MMNVDVAVKPVNKYIQEPLKHVFVLERVMSKQIC